VGAAPVTLPSGVSLAFTGPLGWPPPGDRHQGRKPGRRSDLNDGEQSRIAWAGDDLAHLNGDTLANGRRWASIAPDQWQRLEERVRRSVRLKDDFITLPFPRLVSAAPRQIAAAVESYKRQAGVIDARLVREVTCAFKASALSDLCEKLRADTVIDLRAGPSVADEKVTLFCEKMPLREVMRQLSRPFGYTWLRSGRTGEYRYELVQDLKSQLLEEELRNRDRNAALLMLQKETDRYRPYLQLSPDEALARAKRTPGEEKRLLELYGGHGWGLVQLYFRLTIRELAQLRAGETVQYSEALRPGEPPRASYLTGNTLPPDLARGVLQSMREIRLVPGEDGVYAMEGADSPKGQPLTALPEVAALIHLQLMQSEAGQFALDGTPGGFVPRKPGDKVTRWSFLPGSDAVAVGQSPSAKVDSPMLDPRLARDPALRGRLTVTPELSVKAVPSTAASQNGETSTRAEPRATIADVLEALHHTTGRPIISDFYTRLYKADAVSIKDRPLFDALNQLCETMRLRWNKEGDWLQFRSATYFHDRMKEVPNRLLSRWASARRQRGVPTLDEIVEMAQLPDEQLDGAEMAEGAQELWGLKEWHLVRDRGFRTHIRFLGGFTPAQRQEAMSPAGLPFTKMPLAQQQQFITHALEFADEPLQGLEELSGALLRVDYTQPGWFRWKHSVEGDGSPWVLPLEPGPQGRRAILPPVRERTAAAALQAARRIFPPVTEPMLQIARRDNPGMDAAQMLPQPSQIVPTDQGLFLIYIPGTTNARPIRILGPSCNLGLGVQF
jgi:hypothetical protein